MVMQKVTGSQVPTEPEAYDLKVGSGTTIDNVQQRLVGMWAYVINERVFENPVLLNNFFGEYAAYVGFYASLVDALVRTTTMTVEAETNRIYREHGDKTATFIDGLVRRTERQISKDAHYNERELKAFNNNINAMQTKLRLYGDESKIMSGRT
jgi:hypothetical protein